MQSIYRGGRMGCEVSPAFDGENDELRGHLRGSGAEPPANVNPSCVLTARSTAPMSSLDSLPKRSVIRNLLTVVS
jgi:hypothetical protein